MSLKIVVLAKQVPDTRNVGPDAMTPQGTVNRAALPAIFQTQRLFERIQVFGIKDGWQSCTIDCALGSHSILTHISGIGYLLGKYNNFQTHKY